MAIKKVDLKAEYKYVCLIDDAIDMEKSKLDEYKKDHDIKHLIFHPEKHPTYFILKNVSAPQYTALLGKHMKFDFQSQNMVTKEESNMFSMTYELFSIGCKHVEENGQRVSIQVEQYQADVLQEVGSVIMDLSKLSDAEKK